MAYAEENTDDKPKSISQEAEEELTDQFKSDLAESTRYMKPLQQRMDKDYEAYRNYRDEKDDCEFKVSDFFEYVETVVPIVTNNRIRASVHSDYPEYVTHAKGMNDILDHTYDVNNWDYVSQELFREALMLRSAFVYTGFDKKYKNGTGRLCIEKKNARWIWRDPNPVDFDDSRYLFVVTPMRPTQVYKDYPDKKKEIKASIQKNSVPNNSYNNSTNDSGGNGWFKTWLGTVKNFLAFNGQNQAKVANGPYAVQQQEISEQDKHKNVIAFIEYWYRDDEDNWRKSCWADDVLLTDEENPFWHGGLPYDILSPVKDIMSADGIPMNEQIENMTRNRNLMMNYVMMNAKLHANPPLLFNTSFGNVKDPQRLKEQADDGVVPVSNPDMIPLNAIAGYMDVPVMPGYATSIFDQLGAIKDAATGVNDSFRGTQQASSGKEVQLQQEAAYTRMKTMIDQFELMNKKISEKVIINSMQFYTQNRGFRIKGDYTKYNNDQQMAKQNGQDMPFDVQPIQKGTDEQGQPVHDRTEFFMYANPSEWTQLDKEGETDDGEEETTETDSGKNGNGQDAKEEDEVKKAFKILQFTVEIEAGSSLPQSRLARREEANELFQAGAIDQESLLEIYDWPDRDEVMKRMQEKAQQQQEAQAKQAQAVEQAKAQAEQQKMQMEMQMKQMELQAKAQSDQVANDAKMQQQAEANRGKVAEQGADNGGGSLAEVIAKVKQDNPQFAHMSDEQVIQALTGAQAQGGQQQQQQPDLAGQLDQVRQSNPEAANIPDDQLIQALTGGGGQ